MLFIGLLVGVFAGFVTNASPEPVPNATPRLDSQGNVMDAHDGTIMRFTADGPYYWYAMGYNSCKEVHGLNGTPLFTLCVSVGANTEQLRI